MAKSEGIPHPGVKFEMEGGILPPTRFKRFPNPFEHDLAIYDCATEDANQENNCLPKGPRKSKERRATVLRLCEERAMPSGRRVQIRTPG